MTVIHQGARSSLSSVEFLWSRTLGGGQTERHGGVRHQDVSEDGSVPCRQRGGALLQQVQHGTSDVSGDVATDVHQYGHMLLTEGQKE